MALAVGPITLVSAQASSLQLSVAAATGGTGPYTYQWYKNLTTGFAPGAGNAISGATALTLTDQQLQPNTQWFYKVVVTDIGAGSATATSAQLGATTAQGSPLDPNQFAMFPTVGSAGRGTQTGTWSGFLDSGFGGTAFAATAIKNVNPTGIVAGRNTLPAFTPCTANSDACVGFIFRSIKDINFTGGMRIEYASGGDEIYLIPTANGNQGDYAQLDLSCAGGVQSKVGSSGAIVVGTFSDVPYIGQPCRVKLQLPSLNFA